MSRKVFTPLYSNLADRTLYDREYTFYPASSAPSTYHRMVVFAKLGRKFRASMESTDACFALRLISTPGLR